MFFALGVLAAGLGLVALLPAIWSRAQRLTMRRLRLLAPVTREEAGAEKDLLRAELTVRERRLEQEMEAVKASKAQDLINLGRHAARIADLDARLKDSETQCSDLDRQLQETRKRLAERTDLLNSSEMALLELTERAERLTVALRELRSDHEELGREKEAVASRVLDYAQTLGALHAQTMELEGDATRMREELAELRPEVARRMELESALAGVTAELAAESASRRKTEETLAALRVSAAEECERRANEVSCLEAALRLMRAEAREQADKLEVARADNSMLQGAINALRKEHARLRVLVSGDGGFHEALGGGDSREEVVSLASRMIDAAPQRGPAQIKRAL
jgi:chromosome segregation ATPase